MQHFLVILTLLCNSNSYNYCDEYNYGDYSCTTCYWDSDKTKISSILVKTGAYSTLQQYYENGTRQLYQSWYLNNNIGKYYEWYDNGYLKVEGSYYFTIQPDLPIQKSFEPIDLFGYIDYTDKAASITNYTYTVPKQGDWIYYYQNGRIKQICQYSLFNENNSNKEVKTGTWLAYDTKGNLQLEQKFVNDSLVSYDRRW